jgi:predicted MFS family arabinose efflux permease
MGLVLLVEVLPKPFWTLWLFGCWAVLWIGSALYSVNSPPYVMHVTTDETRNQVFAAQGIVLAFMGFVGSFAAGVLPGLFVTWTGGLLDQLSSYRYALWAAPVAYLLCALLWVGTRPVHVENTAEVVSTASKPMGLFAFLVLIILLQTASEGALLSFFTVYLDTHLEVPTAHIGAIVGTGQLLSIVGIFMVPQLLYRWGAPSTLRWATLGLSVAMLPLALLPHWVPAAIGFISASSMSAINGPVRNVLSQEIVLPQWRTTTSALLTIGLALGWASAAALGGYLIVQAGFSVLFLISAVMALAAGVLLWGYKGVQ